MQNIVIFDLDGTLINSLADIAYSANLVLEHFNFPTHPLESYKYFVGEGALRLVERMAPKETPASTLVLMHQKFEEVYAQNTDKHTKPYDGIYELLHALEAAGTPMAILSNKPHALTQACVKKHLNAFSFVAVLGQQEHIKRKPSEEGVEAILNLGNFDKNASYFVGDTLIDMQTATNAQLHAVGVTWGFREEVELVSNGAEFIARTSQDLLEILLQKN